MDRVGLSITDIQQTIIGEKHVPDGVQSCLHLLCSRNEGPRQQRLPLMLR